MSDETPERLAAFRAEYTAADQRPLRAGLYPISIALFAIGVANVAILLFVLLPAVHRGQTEAALPASDSRALGAYLAEKNLPGAALEEYRRSLETESLTPDEFARVCVSAAEVAIQAEQYENALAFLYRSELIAPDSTLKPDIDKKIALCLEKLNRSSDLRHELRTRSALQRTKIDLAPNEIVLAQVGETVITNRDLETQIDAMPASVRSSFDTPEKREELLRNLVAEKLLVEKARRLELDKDESIQKALAGALDELMVRKLIEDDIRANVKIAPEDVERFYRAEIARFTRPATAKVVYASAGTQEEATALTAFGETPSSVVKGKPIPGIAESDAIVDALLALEVGAISKPARIGDKWYVFKVIAKTPEEVTPFDQVKEVCQRLLEQQKRQEQTSALISRALESSDVKLHPDRLREAMKQ